MSSTAEFIKRHMKQLVETCTSYNVQYNHMEAGDRHTQRAQIRRIIKDIKDDVFVGMFAEEDVALRNKMLADNDPYIHNVIHAALLELQQQGMLPSIALRAMITKGGGKIADLNNLTVRGRMVYNVVKQVGKQLIKESQQ